MSGEQINWVYTPTPHPWLVEYETNEVKLRGANGDIVADSVEYYPHAISRGDAEFIKHRVNAYDTLMTALRTIASVDDDGFTSDGHERAAETALAAITRAG